MARYNGRNGRNGYKRKYRRSAKAYNGRMSGYSRRPHGTGVGYLRSGGYYGRFQPSHGEMKFFDTVVNSAAVSATGAIASDSLNHIVQDTTETGRIGRKCTLRAINWRYTVTLPEVDAQATPASSDTLRIIMYLDKQCNGAIATVLGILEIADHQSFRNLSESNRFSLLFDKTVAVNYQGLASDGAGLVSQALVNYEDAWYKKVSIPLEFSGVTGAIAEIRSNNLGVLLISSGATVTFTSIIRLRFSDSSA